LPGLSASRPAPRSLGCNRGGNAACRLARDRAHAVPDRTERPVTAPTTPARQCGDEAELFRCHHRDLLRAVSRVVDAPPELIEDACQNAWTIMLGRQPDRVSIFAWLRVVAVHEAYRLCRAHQRDTHLEDVDRCWEAFVAGGVTLDDLVEARRALALLARLPARQREDLSLLVAGFSYREIAEMTGGRTLTNVTKQLAKARARMRAQAS
jgi:RNA polymerase sigma factor (sigma-70 family)